MERYSKKNTILNYISYNTTTTFNFDLEISVFFWFSSVRTVDQLETIHWTFKENSLKLQELSSVNLVQVSNCSKTAGSIRDDAYWIITENSLELIELSSIDLVQLSFYSKTGSIRDDPYRTPSRTGTNNR